MHHSFVYLLLLCSYPWTLVAQAPPSLEELQEVYTQTQEDSTRAALLLEMSALLPSTAADSSIVLLQQSAAISQQQLQSSWGLPLYAKAMAKLGNLYRQSNQFALSKATFRKMISTGQMVQDSILLSDAYSDLAYTFSEQEQDDSATYYDLKALKIRLAIQSPKIGSSYNNLGFDYKIQGNFKTALEYYNKAIDYKKAHGEGTQLGNTYMNVGNIYQELKDWEAAWYYHNMALQQARALQDTLFMAEALHSVGRNFAGKGNLDRASAYYRQAMEFFEQLQRLEHPRTIHTYHEWVKVLTQQQQFAKADTLLNQVASILTANNMQLSYYMREHYKVREQWAWQQQLYPQARSYAQQYQAVTDSLHARTLQQKKYALLTQYEDELKEARIQSLEQQQQIDQLNYEKINRQRLILGVALLLLLGVVFFLYQLNQWRSRVNEQLSTLNATKDKLFSIIAHDLKNPLSAFRSITQSLSDGFVEISKEELEYFINRLNTSAHNLYELLQNLLYWSIAQSGRLEYHPQTLNVQSTATSILQVLSESAQLKDISLQNQLLDTDVVWADEQMTRTILRNLLANAIKFTPEGGKITLSSTLTQEGLQIAIQDTGRGIAPDAVPNLFSIKGERPRGEGSGTGLGLILCQELADRQGGKIWLARSSSQGSTFCLLLPISSS